MLYVGFDLPDTRLATSQTKDVIYVRRKVAAMFIATLMGLGLIAVPATAAQPRTTATWSAECPTTVHCVVVPAAYSANSGDVTDYGNYDVSDRPNDMAINNVVIHVTDGSLSSAISEFQNSTTYVSVQYIVDRDGTIYEMVPNKDVAWHSGNWWYNMHSIGIEHVGYSDDPTSFTPAMYAASAQLVKYLAAKYGIPRDRGHIIGHDNVPGVSAAGIRAQHVDPGPFWNWGLYMALIGAPVLPHGDFTSGMVTVAPIWPLSKQVVTGCTAGSSSCIPQGLQPTNFVYLHTSPDVNAPFVSDLVLGQGSPEIANNASRLFYGQTFATVEPPKLDGSGVWYHIWEDGQTGWFYSPWNAPTAFPATGKTVTPKPGTASVPVYGRPIPEASVYPTSLISVAPASFWIPTLAPPAPLPYTMASGQRYAVADMNPPDDHFYAWASDASFPYDHTVFTGLTRYIEVSFGNRFGFVKASDVIVQ
jgi:hypothetical protein